MGWLVFSNLYVALCGAALTAGTYSLLGVPARADAAVLMVFAATLVVYNLDRLAEPNPGNTAHERWVAKHRGALWVLTLAAGLTCDITFWWLSPAARWSLVLPALLALGYCVPVVPDRPAGDHARRWRRLKDVPGMKLLLIGGVWTYATAWLPLIASGVEIGAFDAGVLLAGRLLFILAVALPFDVPDMARDRASGIVTLPQWLGVAGARRVALGLMLGFLVFAAMHPWPAAAALLLSGAVSLGLLWAMHANRGVVYYAVALDGLLLVQSALVLAIAMDA